jgi:hypothetical protein
MPFSNGSEGTNLGSEYQTTRYFDTPITYLACDGRSTNSEAFGSVTVNFEVLYDDR